MSTIIYILFHFDRVGGLFRCSGLLLGHGSVFPDTSPKPISALNKSKHNQQDITTHTWPPHLEPFQLGRPVPPCLRHPLGSCQPAKTTGTYSLHRGLYCLKPLFQD